MSDLTSTAIDAELMARALRLAERGLYTTAPNPRVGCVLSRDGRVIGEGWHQRAGEPHAEINALAAASEPVTGCTAYVTLEPCSHYGRTPPCCDALIAAGVSRVWMAMEDPNPEVAGRGIERLKAAGIEVGCGLLESEARALNPGFIKRMLLQRPYVRCKLAMSVDGRTAMASGESQWITGPDARSDVQRLRARSSAVITGVGSILADDSALTLRENELTIADAQAACDKPPLRVVLDSGLQTPLASRVLQDGAPTLLVCAQGVDESRLAEARECTEVIELPAVDGRVCLATVLDELARRECNEVLLEAGATLAGAALEADLIDELVVYMAPLIMGSNARPLLWLPLDTMAQKRGLEIVDVRAVGKDWRITALPERTVGARGN